jgi:hypothetical protein
MKKSDKKTDRGADMKSEYDFAAGERGKYAALYGRGTNVVVLDPDVAKAFPSSESVNNALRSLAAIIRNSPGRPR